MFAPRRTTNNTNTSKPQQQNQYQQQQQEGQRSNNQPIRNSSLPQHYAQHLKRQAQQKAPVYAFRRTSLTKQDSRAVISSANANVGEVITPHTHDSTRNSHEEILKEINVLEIHDHPRRRHSLDYDEYGPMHNVVIQAHSSYNDEMSQMTDDFGTVMGGGKPSRYVKGMQHVMEEEGEGNNNFHHHHEDQVLFTFSRGNVETTLNSKIVDKETMEDLVKRLQQKGSSLLKFSRDEIRSIRAQEKEVVFVLKALQGATFSKDEFGLMKASDVQNMTIQRPILVEIQTQDVVEGETFDVF